MIDVEIAEADREEREAWRLFRESPRPGETGSRAPVKGVGGNQSTL